MPSRVIDDTRAARFSEKNRRFINVNPVTSSKKIHAANDLIALTYGSLPNNNKEWVGNNQQIGTTALKHLTRQHSKKQ